MAVVGNLLVNLSLESRQFLSGIQQATVRTAAATTSIQNSMKTIGDIGKGLAAAFAVDWLAGQVQSSLDYADAIVDLSDATGVGTRTLQEFRYAAQLSGSSVEDADAAIGKFAKNMGEAKNGNEAMRKTFHELGITSGDIDTAIRQAADGIQKLDDKQKQSAATMGLFGKSAGTLTNLLSGGSSAFDELANAAQNLGIVLSDEVLRNAGQVNDQMDSLKMILSAQMANTVAQNATSIASLASSMATLTGEILKFWQSNPEATLAILGGLAGVRMGGLVGGAIGAVGGAALGYSARQHANDVDMSIGNRQKQLSSAQSAYNAAKAESAKPNPGFATFLGSPKDRAAERSNNLKAAADELKRQQALMVQAKTMATAPTKPGRSSGTGTIPAPKVTPAKVKKPSGPSAAEIEKRFNDELSRGYVDYLRAREDLQTEVVERAALQREQLSIETEAKRRDILADKHMSSAQKAQLTAMLDKAAYERADLINRNENEELARERLDIALAANDNEKSVLSGAQSLARTQDERRRIGLRLIDLEYQRERLSLEAIIASHEATETEKKIAAAKLAVLGTLQDNDKTSLTRSTMGPLASYLDGIPKTAGEINEALETVAANGLERLNDGLTDAIMGAGSLKDAFGDMASFVISELIKITLKAAIITPLGNALSGMISGGGAGSFFSSIFGKRANGGYTAAGSYLVGERGPELVNIGTTANVTPNHAIRSLGGGKQIVVNSTVSGVNDPHMVRRLSQESILQAMPISTKLSSDRTLRDARRPKMR